MKKTYDHYGFKRKLYAVLTVIFLILTVISFLVSIYIRDGIWGIKDTSYTFGIISYCCLLLTALFLGLELYTPDPQKPEPKK